MRERARVTLDAHVKLHALQLEIGVLLGPKLVQLCIFTGEIMSGTIELTSSSRYCHLNERPSGLVTDGLIDRQADSNRKKGRKKIRTHQTL